MVTFCRTVFELLGQTWPIGVNLLEKYAKMANFINSYGHLVAIFYPKASIFYRHNVSMIGHICVTFGDNETYSFQNIVYFVPKMSQLRRKYDIFEV